MRHVFWATFVLFVYGCGGGGGGTSDTAGTGGTLPFPATLASIQEKVFSPTCASGCHEPGGEGYNETNLSGGMPLDLSSVAASYSSLVGIPSTIPPKCGTTITESGTLPCGDRVVSGDPDASWLIAKLEGKNPAFTGDKMPRNAAPLSQDEIDVIRQWIEEGAQNN